MSEPWHGINDPGFFWKPKPEPEGPKKPTGMDESPTAKKEPLAKEYRFKDVSITEPAQGFEKNKPFDIEGEIELLGDKLTASKILLYPIGLYNDQEDKFVPAGIEADLDTSTNKFCGTCDHLFDPEAYVNDSEKTSDATWKLFVRAEGKTAEKPMESEQLTFPKESQFVELKKGHYDENGAEKYNKDKADENFKENNAVKSLQSDLIKTGFLPQGADDGFFGDQTDAAVRKFQEYAIKNGRMKRSEGKVENTDRTLDLQSPDGVVDKKTRDEIDRWLQNDWIRPVPTLRYKEYDDKGVDNGKGSPGSDEHHVNTPVADAQKDLQSVGVYAQCSLDGWFHDKMLDAVKQFQDAAAQGEFCAADNTRVVLDDKLVGFCKAELDAPTQEYLKKAVDQGLTVPKKDDVVFPQKTRPSLSFHGGRRYFGADRDDGRKHAGCDLMAPVGTEILAVKDGTVVKVEDGFFKGASAIGINHGDFIVRYCETKPEFPEGIKVGSKVKQGQVIAYVGKLEGSTHSMLHFEMYSGAKTGSFTNTNNEPYRRRDDLMDPTETLDKAKLIGQK